MFKLGLTGSIGMGKSTTAQMFVDAGCAVWDADAAVHRLYSKGGQAVAPMKAKFPDAVVNDEVSRAALKDIIGKDPTALRAIEEIVHPLVFQDRLGFTKQASSDIAVYDIPLLFEKGGQSEFDAVACVFVDQDTQQQRVMDRGTMTQDQFEMIRVKQMPSSEKQALADYLIETDTLDHARAQVQDVVSQIRKTLSNA